MRRMAISFSKRHEKSRQIWLEKKEYKKITSETKGIQQSEKHLCLNNCQNSCKNSENL